MSRANPSNPFTQDQNHTSKDVQMPIAKARVMNVTGMPEGDGFHTARVRVYGDGSSYVAPVLTIMEGVVSVPKEGDDVAVLFTQHDKPWIIGSWYALDRVEDGDTYLPDYEVGDLVLGNHTGSHVTIHNDGSISLQTAKNQTIDIEVHSGVAHLSTNQTIPNDDNYYIVEWDDIESNDERLFDSSTHSYTLIADGKYRISASAAIQNAGQGNRYGIAIFVNGQEVKRTSRQSQKDAEMSVDVSTTRNLQKGDEIDIRVRQDSSSDKTLLGNKVTNDFIINREGI